MTIRYVLISLVGAAALLPAVALAQDESSGMTASITAGTLGIGPEVGYRPSSLLGIRASATFLRLSHDVDVDTSAISAT